MGNVIAFIFAVVVMAGILLFAKRFLKPPKDTLPDCCGHGKNRDIDGRTVGNGSGCPQRRVMK
jgi:hypothetical protein